MSDIRDLTNIPLAEEDYIEDEARTMLMAILTTI